MLCTRAQQDASQHTFWLVVLYFLLVGLTFKPVELCPELNVNFPERCVRSRRDSLARILEGFLPCRNPANLPCWPPFSWVPSGRRWAAVHSSLGWGPRVDERLGVQEPACLGFAKPWDAGVKLVYVPRDFLPPVGKSGPHLLLGELGDARRA